MVEPPPSLPLNTGIKARKLRAVVEITRFDKPIGTFLLLAPTLLCLFVAGAIVMRSAGCVANDLADRNLDGHVERTRLRPLVSGALSVPEAVFLLVGLLSVALILVALTNPLTIKLSIAGLALALIYPLMKRVTHLPQIVLGLAFSWSIPMAFAASTNSLPSALWWLFVANLLWTVIYDTQYAMVDREDDLTVGIKSTAILFGHLDVRIIGLLQGLCVIAFCCCGAAFNLGVAYYAAIIAVGLLFTRHLWLIKDRDTQQCFRAFNQSKWIGVLILSGLCADFWLRSLALD